MAFHCLLAIVMCQFICLEGTRLHRLEVQSYGHPNNIDLSNVVDDEQLLACVVVETEEKVVIQRKDKPFWDYYYKTANWQHFAGDFPSWDCEDGPLSLNCKIYTRPPKPSSTLSNLTTPDLNDDVIGHIASFHDSAVQCRTCKVKIFDMKFLEKCSTPSTPGQFLMVHTQVNQEGGFCKTKSKVEWGLSRGGSLSQRTADDTLQNCIRLNSYDDNRPGARPFAACELQHEGDIQKLIEENAEKVLVLEKFINERKQDIVDLKHISEGL